MQKVSIFDHEELKRTLVGLRLFEDTGTNSLTVRKSENALPSEEDVDEESHCLTCDFAFTSRQEQIEHYKSDWHRYNLKLKLNGAVSISQDEFGNIIDEISSISGSDSDGEEDSDSEKSEQYKMSKALDRLTIEKSNDPASPVDSSFLERNRTPKVHLSNSCGKTISFYRSILPQVENNDAELIVPELNQILLRPVKCLIILLSAGHFAASIFDGATPTVHKTFHRYVLRAKQGTVQSMHDNKGHAPKSGGASIRRHNEMALINDIQNLLNSWMVEHISNCTHIFLRAPHYAKGTFYNGKIAPLDRKDERIRGIPFPTRRPTFNELKRVHKELFSLSVKDIAEAEISLNIDCRDETVGSAAFAESKSDDKKETIKKLDKPDTNSPKRRKRKKEKAVQNAVDIDISIPTPEENTVEDQVTDELYTVCKVGNLEGLMAILASLKREFSEHSNMGYDVISVHLNQPITKENNGLLHIAAKAGHRDIIFYLLENGADPAVKNDKQQVPYLVSSDKAMRNTFRKFMAQYPDRYDYKSAQVPGPLTDDMESQRKAKLNEKKKVQKALKKEKEKEAKAEKRKALLEEQEKQRFSALSDREKRAIAAERRFAHQLSSEGASLPNNVKRCWLCGNSLLGRIPFEYFDYQFCSINCLKKHKSLENHGS